MSTTGYQSCAEIPRRDARFQPESRRQLFGAALVVLSAASIAVVPTLARFAYDGGSDTLTVITARSIVSAVSCILVTLALGRPLAIGRRALGVSLALGVL